VFVFHCGKNTLNTKLGEFFTRILLADVIRDGERYKLSSRYFSDKTRTLQKLRLKNPLIKSELLSKVARFLENILTKVPTKT